MSGEERPISPEWIERVIPAGPGRAVVDLFQGAGTLRPGQVIYDFGQKYRVEMVLARETPYSGGRVLTTLLRE